MPETEPDAERSARRRRRAVGPPGAAPAEPWVGPGPAHPPEEPPADDDERLRREVPPHHGS